MNDPLEPRQAVPAGLCADCRHAAIVVSDRGSTFVRCERSKTDPRFPRYPPLPMRRCDGHEPKVG